MQNYASIIAQELNIRPQQTEAVIRLLDEDATVPFIARYRKEATEPRRSGGHLIRDRLAAPKEFDKRRSHPRLAGERGLSRLNCVPVEAADALTVPKTFTRPNAPSAAPAPQWRRARPRTAGRSAGCQDPSPKRWPPPM
ncbi:MAG: Tex-like N-terminal domain-containing protein [Bilophila wadsworthia]